MATDLFFKKRIGAWITACFAVVFTLSAVCYAWFLSAVETVSIRKSFYFLVSDSTHVEASTYTAILDGGAGYLLETEGRDYVALSVYLNEADGLAVASAFSSEEKVLIVTQRVDKIYLKTKKEKKNAAEITGAFSSLFSCIEVLEKEIRRMDEGATQRSAKRTLDILGHQLDYLGKTYERKFSAFAKTCQKAVKTLSEIVTDTVFVKDLRWVLCELCTSYTRLAASFSL